MRHRQPNEDPAAEVAQGEEADGENDDDRDGNAEHDLDLRREPVPEAPEAGRQAEHRDGEEIEDPLDEHRAEASGSARPGLLILRR